MRLRIDEQDVAEIGAVVRKTFQALPSVTSQDNVDKAIGEAVANFVLEKLDKVLDKHESKQRWHFAAPVDQRLDVVIKEYKNSATQALAASKALRDDMLVYFRAMAMVVDMAANAGTHSEKNARLRGISEVIESAINNLRKQEFDFNNRWWNERDIFRSDYPVRELLGKVRQLQNELAQARGEKVEPLDETF